MKYNEILVSDDATHFLLHGELLFGRKFRKVLKFHAEGLAPVCDETGWYHIELRGLPAYNQRYQLAFGFYFGCAAVAGDAGWFHINTDGMPCYSERYSWCGNFQEERCSVRNKANRYLHINMKGQPAYDAQYLYAGDYREGFAVVKLCDTGRFIHIDKQGNPLNNKTFMNLGVFHKSIASACDENGWYHIDKQGNELYSARYRSVEPFYNGTALVQDFPGNLLLIAPDGTVHLQV